MGNIRKRANNQQFFKQNFVDNIKKDDLKQVVSSYNIATRWTCDIFAVCAMMAGPPLGGSWIDLKLGTVCVFTLIGAFIGFIGGIYYLLKLVNRK